MLFYKLFNGLFGCSFCLHPGSIVQNKRVYPFDICDIPPLRSLDGTLNILENIRNNVYNEKSGITGDCYLNKLGYFNIHEMQSIDSMHNIFINIFKTIFGLFFNKSNHQEEYYINDEKRNKISKLITNQNFPRSFLRRKLRPLSEFSNYKAYEKRLIMFYLFDNFFGDYLESKYFNIISHFFKQLKRICCYRIKKSDLVDIKNELCLCLHIFRKLFGVCKKFSKIIFCWNF